mmetsp:Transcript_47862/g.150100  ORF Transcript_47862/g.150100 Transcript_47862/m.150100 type:complete len:100 (+) Transcript_47862:3246-3545(+)
MGQAVLCSADSMTKVREDPTISEASPTPPDLFCCNLNARSHASNAHTRCYLNSTPPSMKQGKETLASSLDVPALPSTHLTGCCSEHKGRQYACEELARW